MKNLVLTMLFASAISLASSLPVRAEESKGAEACIGDCRKCAERCEKTLEYFQSKGGKYLEPDKIRLLKDCIATCKLSAEFKSRNSEFQGKAASLCADVCHKCAAMCDELKDPQLKDCVDMCNTCASSCAAHGKTTGGAGGDCCSGHKRKSD
ncbi:MAG TPA: four-helix bundle copper-binding protein [Candidatus Obscuribacterales bacterium]